MAQDPTTTKYIIKANLQVEGIVEKPDIVGAVFGQTEGLLGNEMDLRDLQKSARIGRLEVDIEQKGGKTSGKLALPSAMDKVESAIIAAALETIDRIGPAKAKLQVTAIEDARSAQRQFVSERAKALLALINEDPAQDTDKISDSVRSAVQVAGITHFRGTKLPAGPNVESSDSIILVEGRNDVLNMLKCGIKNAIGVEGTSIPKEVQDISREKTTTIFVDGDRGGELIAKELLQTCEVDFVARAPNTREVEELPHKLVMKCLKNKLTAEQFISQLGLSVKRDGGKSDDKPPVKQAAKKTAARDAPKDDEESSGRGRGRSRRGRGARKDEDDTEPAKKTAARGRGRGRGGAKAEEDDDNKGRNGAAKPERKAAHDPRAGFRDALSGLSGSLKAVILDKDGKTIQDGLPVRELADTLKSGKTKVQAVVFDGVITQRLLDIAHEKSIATVVGVKMGNVTKVPDDVEILTRDDLS